MTSMLSIVIAALSLAIIWRLGRRALFALDRANGADWGSVLANRIDGFIRIYVRRVHRLPETCLPLPERGAALLVANHCSGLDPLLLIAASRRPLRFVIAQEQYRRFGLQWLFRTAGCIPVNRERRPERAFREALKALAAGEVVALFPHGAIHLETDPPRLLKPGVARLAQLAGVPVHAARIEGVRGQGLVVRAVLLPGRARVEGFPPIACHTLPTEQCLAQLAALIDP